MAEAIVEALGEETSKKFGHVLDDDDGHGKIGGDGGNDFGERVGAAGRCADGKDFDAGLGAFGDGDGLRRFRRRERGLLVAKSAATERLDFGEEIFLDAQHGDVEAAGVAGLGDISRWRRG